MTAAIEADPLTGKGFRVKSHLAASAIRKPMWAWPLRCCWDLRPDVTGQTLASMRALHQSLVGRTLDRRAVIADALGSIAAMKDAVGCAPPSATAAPQLIHFAMPDSAGTGTC
jgi:hypothetical protein